MFAKLAYTPPSCAGSMWMFSWRSGGSSIRDDDTRAVTYAIDRLAALLSEQVGTDVELERPKDAELGDFATNVALRTAKAAGRPPRELAEELVPRFAELDQVVSAEVA